MDIDFANQPIHGLHRDLFIGQQDRTGELNTRISNRHFPDTQLRPNFSPRPVPTKYSLFPVIERRIPAKEAILPVPVHAPETNFNPATTKYPFSSYLEHYDVEENIRKQSGLLSRGRDDGVYVPSSNSDLFDARLPPMTGTGANTHPLLFFRESFAGRPTDEVGARTGQSQFFNHTRTQLRGMNDQT